MRNDSRGLVQGTTTAISVNEPTFDEKVADAVEETKALRLQIIAYNPGYTLGTGLGRNLPNGTFPGPIMALSPYFAKGMRIQVGGGRSRSGAGANCFAERAFVCVVVRGQLTWAEPSELVRRDDAAQKL